MAGYRKLKNGKWEISISIGFDLKGKRIRKYKTVEAKNKREVELQMAKFLNESRGNINKGGTIKLNEFFNLWIEDYAEKSLRKKTVSRYKTLWPRINECLGHFSINELKVSHLIQFYKMLSENGVRLDKKEGGLSASTIKHHHTLISTVLQNAVLWDLIDINPCSKVRLAKIGVSNRDTRKKTEEMMYSLDQAKMLLKKVDNEEVKYKTLIYLAVFTGCRREELMGLEWKDIDFENREIKIRRSSQYTVHDGIFEDDLKNFKSIRNCFLPKEVVVILKEYKLWWEQQKLNATKIGKWNETDKIFIQKYGKNMHPDTPSSWFKKFLERVDLPHTRFHNLRHIHISILLLMGMDMNSIADQVGHSDLQMIVKTYSHNIRKNLSETADYLTNALLND